AHRVYITRFRRGTVMESSVTSYRRYLDFKQSTTSFDAMTTFTWSDRAVGRGDATKFMPVGLAGWETWTMFDAKPVIGRFYGEAEDTPPAGTNVVVLSYAFWQTQ